MSKTHSYPAWFYGPGGASKIFHSDADVPAGWHDHPSKASGDKPAPAPAAAKPAPTPAAAPSSAAAPANSGPAPGTGVDPATIDAEGYAFDPELHAATRSITKGGVWRMKVGVSRPAPKPGFPKPALDL